MQLETLTSMKFKIPSALLLTGKHQILENGMLINIHARGQEQGHFNSGFPTASNQLVLPWPPSGYWLPCGLLSTAVPKQASQPGENAIT